MTTSVFIRNDSQKDSGHNVFVGLRYIADGPVVPCSKAPLEPGDEITTTVYGSVELVIREVAP